ncbi:MAG: nitronate monooxygenase [Burkholderiaceae bacterium]
MTNHHPVSRAADFSKQFGMKIPVLMAPMAGACPPALARAVARAGGMGATGALLDSPSKIDEWVRAFRADNGGDLPLQMNLWIPDPSPRRDPEHEARVRAFLANWGPVVPADAFESVVAPVFDQQVDALIAARPTALSSIMGLYSPAVVERLHQKKIAWFACVTTVAEARAAEQAGADVIVAQGAEAGGHRGAFDAVQGVDKAAGLFALLPQVVDAVSVPVVATGGIADARGVAAALLLGASAVQIGTGLLRTDESTVAPAWSSAIGQASPDGTRLTRAFSGRWGRAIASDYVLKANSSQAPEPAPYPVQRGLTGAMRQQAIRDNDISRLQAWAGQSGALAQTGPAGDIVQQIWADACQLLTHAGGD